MSDKDSKPAPPTSPPPGQQTLTIEQGLALAMQHLSANRPSEAADVYQLILQSDPAQPVALHRLGVIAHQMGRSETAVDLITMAIANKPDYVGAHNNLGNVLKQ